MIATLIGAACPTLSLAAAITLAVLIRREHRSKP